MKNAKRLKKLAIRSLLDSIARSLHRQAVAAEQTLDLFEQSIACHQQSLSFQEQHLELAKKGSRYSHDMAAIAKRQFSDQLLATTNRATMLDEAP